jgi:hypothetical protein
MRNIRYGKKSMALVALLLLIGVSFAANVIGDVPSSEADLRKIVEEDTLYDGADVDIEQGLAFYDGSPQYLRIAQPKGPVSYVYDKTETFVRIYG